MAGCFVNDQRCFVINFAFRRAMKLRLPGFSICLLAFACSAPLVVVAQEQDNVAGAFSAVGSDPGELYYHAWRMCSDAEHIAQEQQYAEALHKNQDALTILSAIARDHPQWKSAMVARRIALAQNNKKKWTELAQKQAVQNAKNNLPVSPEITDRTGQGAALDGQGRGRDSLPGFEELERQRQAQVQRSPNDGYMPPISPTTVESAGSSYTRMEQEVVRLRMENDALIQALRETKKELLVATRKRVLAEADAKAREEQYQELAKQLRQERTVNSELVQSLTKQLETAKRDLETSKLARQQAEEQVRQLTKQLEQSNEMLAEVTRERDSLKEEREQLAAIIELNSPDKTKNLLDTNLSLAAKLKEAEAKIARLENEKQESEDMRAANLRELENTRAEAAKLKTQLAAIYDENMGYRKRISELNTKLVNTEAELERLAASESASPLDIEENRILRSAVSKQMRLLATQVKSRELLIESYTRLKLKDPAMAEALKMLKDGSNLELTPAEKELLAKLESREKAAQDSSNSQLSEVDRQRLATEQSVRSQYEMEAIGLTAEKAFSKGRYAAAEQLYKTLIDNRPDHFPARVNLGTILLKRNLVEEAIMHLTRAVEIDKNSGPAQFLLGIARYRAGQDKEAMMAFQETVRIEPDNAMALLYMGNIESTSNRSAEAVKYYEQALKINPKFADAHFNMASTLARMGKFKEARVAYDKAINAGALPDLALQDMLEQESPLPPVEPVSPIASASQNGEDQKSAAKEQQLAATPVSADSNKQKVSKDKPVAKAEPEKGQQKEVVTPKNADSSSSKDPQVKKQHKADSKKDDQKTVVEKADKKSEEKLQNQRSSSRKVSKSQADSQEQRSVDKDRLSESKKTDKEAVREEEKSNEESSPRRNRRWRF